ncbi:MAG: DUF2079 domain-containing protein [Candidatus Riflebacteria bacterium]|nr:DUF2079 domain-containing protein [Candidatus Riflebacteria bacterium]
MMPSALSPTGSPSAAAPSPAPPSPPALPGVWLAVLVAMAGGWFALCLYATWLRWDFWMLGIDTSSYAQLLARFDQGLGWTYTTHIESTGPIAIFRYHFHLLLYPLYGLYKLLPHPLVLFVVQHGLHAAGAVTAGILAWRLVPGDGSLAALATLAWLLFPQHLLGQSLFDFSFRHFSLLLIPLAGLFWQAGRPVAMLAALAVMVAGTEELALTAAFFLLAAAWQSPADRGRLAVGAVACFGYLGLMTWLGMNHHALGWRYAHFRQGLGPTLAVLLSELNAQYLLFFVGPLLFLPLLRPTSWLLACVPGAAQVLFTSTLDTHAIGHHHSAAFGATLLLANLFALGRLPAAWARRVLLGQVLGIAVALLFLPVFPMIDHAADPEFLARRECFRSLAAVVGPRDSISGPTYLATHFWQNPEVFLFPFHADDADWVVVPARPTGYPPVGADTIREHAARLHADPRYRQVLANQEFLAFRRNP